MVRKNIQDQPSAVEAVKPPLVVIVDPAENSLIRGKKSLIPGNFILAEFHEFCPFITYVYYWQYPLFHWGHIGLRLQTFITTLEELFQLSFLYKPGFYIFGLDQLVLHGPSPRYFSFISYFPGKKSQE